MCLLVVCLQLAAMRLIEEEKNTEFGAEFEFEILVPQNMQALV